MHTIEYLKFYPCSVFILLCQSFFWTVGVLTSIKFLILLKNAMQQADADVRFYIKFQLIRLQDGFDSALDDDSSSIPPPPRLPICG